MDGNNSNKSIIQPIISSDSFKSLPLHELVRLQKILQQEIASRLSTSRSTSPIPDESVLETPKAEIPEENVKKGLFTNTSIITGKLKATATRLIKTVDVWPVLSWQQHAHKDVIWDNTMCRMPLDPSGLNFSTCSADTTAKIWVLKDSTKEIIPLCIFTGHKGSINSIEFHPTQQLAVTSSGDNTCQIWKPSLPATLTNNIPNISSGSLNDSTRLIPSLVSSISSKFKRTVETTCNSVSEALVTLNTSGVNQYAVWNSAGNRIITATQEICKLWDLSRSDTPIQVLTGHDKYITHISAHPSHPSLFITSSNDSTFRLWDMRSPSFIVNVFHGHQKPVSCAHFIPSKNAIISGGDDCTLRTWDLNTFTCCRTIYTSYNENRFSLSDTQDICVPSNKGTAVIYNLYGENTGILSTDVYNQRKMILKCNWYKDVIITCGIDRSIAVWKQSNDHDE